MEDRMSSDNGLRDYILDQLSGMGEFETKNMFGGTALLRNGVAFAKIKHGSLWLKADDGNINDFKDRGMMQYTYGKNNSRTLNFYETPDEIMENSELLVKWASKACEAANRSKK
jgi:TfoX/Sxy family transcriptional regulator of competence genes